MEHHDVTQNLSVFEVHMVHHRVSRIRQTNMESATMTIFQIALI